MFTVTWNVFGVCGLETWLPELLDRSIGPATRPSTWQARFWTRQPHPDTGLCQHGPESELSVTSDGWRYEFEAKWLQDLDGKQGKDHQQTQIQMRAYCAQLTATHEERWGVVVIAPSPRLYPPAQRSTSVFRRYFEPDGDIYTALPPAVALRTTAITWEQVHDILTWYGTHRKVADYLAWRLALITSHGIPE